jgi:hypothetical protein
MVKDTDMVEAHEIIEDVLQKTSEKDYQIDLLRSILPETVWVKSLGSDFLDDPDIVFETDSHTFKQISHERKFKSYDGDDAKFFEIYIFELTTPTESFLYRQTYLDNSWDVEIYEPLHPVIRKNKVVYYYDNV